MYLGFLIFGGTHLPLKSGLALVGLFHSPHPAALHFGLGTSGASHSPSSSSSQSSGVTASGSETISGSSSCHSAGLTASSSGMNLGASSSQSSGLVASGSSIISSSIQSEGFLSVGSSICLGGLTGGSKLSSSEPVDLVSPSMRTSNELSSRITSVYTCVFLSFGTWGAFFRCFSSNSPVLGLLWRKMKCTLSVAPHLSGPNMMVYGLSSLNLFAEKPSTLDNNLMYPPSHPNLFSARSSY
mmetsp:Transcript_4855/g.11662  ORF Transcript_4855/g.11662 Transcript_4855/m.11662 type:complete len:241 (-) Transcript_4855:379-1101(-)